MYRKSILIVVALFTLMVFAACATAAPPAAEEAPAAAAEAEATEAPAAEAEAEATEAPAEEAEAEATEAPAEEAEAEATEAPAEETSEGSEAASEDGAAMTYTVDTEASTIAWYGSKPIGASESGTIRLAEGTLTLDGETLADGMMVIDMTTIETDSQSGGMAERLVGHLGSDDFFGVETYPTATLVIKSAEPTDVEGQYAVTADLTIKEITDEIEFLADVTRGDGTIEATAEIVVDRSIYDVRYGSGAFFSDLGDDLISDEMEMTVTLVARG